MYYSQYAQDKYLEEKFFSNMREGFFIEIGADDGIDKSNTFFFENKGWSGICIEPSPTRYKALEKNRNCECLNIAISSKMGKVAFLDIVGYGKGLSGIIQNYNPKHVTRINNETKNNAKTISKKEIVVDVFPLAELLRARKIRRVNYCSIDVEGSEFDILTSVDFKEVQFDILSIEDPYDDSRIRDIMSSNGFKFDSKIGPDLIFVNEKFSM